MRKLFPVLAEQDARKEMDFLLSVCRSPWGIRGAMNLYTNAASANDVSYENLYRMAAHMGIGIPATTRAAWCRLLQTLCWRFARNAS